MKQRPAQREADADEGKLVNAHIIDIEVWLVVYSKGDCTSEAMNEAIDKRTTPVAAVVVEHFEFLCLCLSPFLYPLKRKKNCLLFDYLLRLIMRRRRKTKRMHCLHLDFLYILLVQKLK